MNRRGFLAAIAGIPLAGLAGLRPEIRFDRVWAAIDAAEGAKVIMGPSVRMTPAQWAKAVGSVHYGKSLPEYLDDYMPRCKEAVEESRRRIKKLLYDRPLTEAFRDEC